MKLFFSSLFLYSGTCFADHIVNITAYKSDTMLVLLVKMTRFILHSETTPKKDRNLNETTACKILEVKWRRQWHPTPVLLLGKSHGRRSLVGCSPWGSEESDTTERLHFHFSLSCIGEGNGNPLQCSCLENPRDGRAWWAAVYGVAQNQTRLKQLSGSSSRG